MGDPEKSGKQNARYQAFHVWPWKSCVKPVLNEVGLREKPPNRALPRICWIGAGLACSLPYHAAGKHHENSTSTVLNIAISTYVPTIRALIHAKHRAQKSSDQNSRHSLLMAMMATTPGEPALQGISNEADAIKGSIAKQCQIVHLEQPNADEVIHLMMGHDIFHFAGHGMSDSTDPAKSSVILKKFEGHCMSPVQDRLQVERLFEVGLQPALLAFLYACSTAENKHERLADESIHLGSGFLVAGFRHVIGFYDRRATECPWTSLVNSSRNWCHAGQKISDVSIAQALHAAVDKVYVSLREMGLLWAPYVLIGT